VGAYGAFSKQMNLERSDACKRPTQNQQIAASAAARFYEQRSPLSVK
jgi:hypothetical protein